MSDVVTTVIPPMNVLWILLTYLWTIRRRRILYIIFQRKKLGIVQKNWHFW